MEKVFTQIHRLGLLSSFLAIFLSTPSMAQTGGRTSINFNGSGDDCTIRNDATLNPRNEITVEAWIKPESFATNIWENSIFCKHGWASGNAGYVLRCGASGSVSFNVASRNGVWQEANSKTGVISTGKWYHIAGTFDGDTVAVYVNGVQVATKLYSGLMTPSSINAKIGELANGTGRNFDGDIDEVKVWTQALERDTLREWMCRKVNSTHPNYGALSGYWKFDEGTGNDIKDVSGNKNHGKVSGGSWSASGAALGDTSVFSFSGAKKLSIKGDDGEVFSINKIKGTHQSIHLYRMDGKSPYDSLDKGRAVLDTIHQWGVYVANPSSSSYNVNFDYGKFTRASGMDECNMDLFKRPSPTNVKWQTGGGTLYASGDSLVIEAEKSGVYVFGLYAVNKSLFTATSDSSFCANDSLELSAPGAAGFSYQWYLDGNKLTNDTLVSLMATKGGKYKADVTRSSKCSFTSNEMTVTSLSIPTVTLSTQAGVCESVDSITLIGGLPKGGVYMSDGVKNDSIFYPATEKRGKYDVVYLYQASNGCHNSDTQSLTVFALPKVSSPKTLDICDDKDTINMKGGTPSGGIYIGKGIVNNIFYTDSVKRKLGKYDYTYEYTDANGCVNQSTGAVEVLFATPIKFNPIDTSCSNDQAFRVKTNPNQGTYTGKGITGNMFYPSVAGVGSHEITFEFKNLYGCVTSASQNAVVVAVTSASITAVDSICTNADSISLSKGSPAGGVYLGDGVSNGAYFIPKGLAAGMRDIGYVFTDANGCVDTADGHIKILDTAGLTLTSVDGLCLGDDQLVLNNVKPEGGEYSGNGVNNGIFEPITAGSGIHSISYLYTGVNGCANSTDFTIEVFEPQNVQLSMISDICNNAEPVEITKVKPKGGTLSGPGVSSTQFDPSMLMPGSYYVVYSFRDDLECLSSDSAKVNVLEAPVVSLSEQSDLCSNDDEVTLSGGAPEGGIYLVNGNEQTSFDPGIGSGSYNLVYAVENVDGCRDSSKRDFFVNDAPEKPTITTDGSELISSSDEGNQWFDESGEIDGATDNRYRPGRDGAFTVAVTNDSGCVAMSEVFTFTGVEALGNSRFEIYPNPANNQLTISSKDHEIIDELTIIGVNGEVVLTARPGSSTASIDVSKLTPGFYTSRLMLDSGHSIVKAFVVTHK